MILTDIWTVRVKLTHLITLLKPGANDEIESITKISVIVFRETTYQFSMS